MTLRKERNKLSDMNHQLQKELECTQKARDKVTEK